MIAARIKALRSQYNMTQKELAAKLNLTPKMISFYELSERFPPHDIICKLADIFVVSTDYLLGKTDDPTPQDAKKEPPSKEEAKLLRLYDKANADDKAIINLTLKKYDEPVVAIAARGNGGVHIIKSSEAERLIRADDELNEEGMLLNAEEDKF